MFDKISPKTPERDMFDTLVKHLDISLKALDMTYEMVIGRCKDPGEAVERANEVLLMEREADELAEDLFVKIIKGSMPPVIVSELQYLVDKTDDIMDHIYFIGMEMSRAYRNGLTQNQVLGQIYSDIGVMMSLAKSGLKKLRELYTKAFRDRDETLRLRAEIDVIEDKIDEVKNQVLNKIYEGGGLKPIEIFHAIQLIRTVDDIADATEDAAHAVVRLESSVIS